MTHSSDFIPGMFGPFSPPMTGFVGPGAYVDAERSLSPVFASPEEHTVNPAVIHELGLLAGVGYKVSIGESSDGVVLPADVQERVTSAITILEERYPESGMIPQLMHPELHSTSERWFRLRKRAIALHPLYVPLQATLGGDLDHTVYDEPLFRNGESAAEILQREEPKRAPRILDNYRELITVPSDDDSARHDEFGLSSSEYIAGVPDAIAVRLRAEVATDLIVEHAKGRTDQRGEYNITSLACGAAGPMLTMVPRLQQSGVDVGKVSLVDWDVMALATAKSLAETEGLSDLVELKRQDLLRSDLTSAVKNADVVDLLGLFEYFPDSIDAGSAMHEGISKKLKALRPGAEMSALAGGLIKLAGKPIKYPLASNFLREVGRGMKPGSAIVFGNMLKDRHHQTMFNQVWPTLFQRTVSEVIELVESAGFPKECLEVRVAKDGVYSVYKLTIPETGLEMPKNTVSQRLGKAVLLPTVKEY